MLWGGGDGMARSPPEVTDGAPHGAPHATAEQLEPVTHCSEPGRHLNRSRRDEPIELARRRHCPWDRAPPAEEARARRGGAAGLARALAGRGDPGWAPDHAHRRRLRGRTRRVLAGPLAPGARDRGLCHPPDKRGRLARTPASEDGSARYRVAQARLPRLAAW